MTDYYQTLGVPRNSDEKEIRKAYRRLARKHHPDLNPGDAAAEREFKKMNEAYEVLSDPENRKKYDRYGEQWKHAEQFEKQYGRAGGQPGTWTYRTRGSGATPGSDLFDGLGLDDLLGDVGIRSGRGTATRRARKPRAEASVQVTLQEAYAGANRQVTITADGRERRIEVAIPPGVDTGSVIHVSPDGTQDIYLKIVVSPHKRLQRKGVDLYTDVEVPFVDAILGGEVDVQTLKGKVRLKVPPESQNGQRIRLAGQGMPKLGDPKTRGALYATLRPDMPDKLNAEERDLIEKFKDLRSDRR